MQPFKRVVSAIVVMALFLVCSASKANLSSLTRNDPYPVFTALDPHEFLLTRRKLLIRDPEYASCKNDLVSFSVSPFGQNANRARNLSGLREFDGIRIELGDLPAGCFTPGGRWGMIAMLFGPLPEGQMLPATLQDAFDTLFPGMVPGTVDNPCLIDPMQRLGFFTMPLK